MCQIVQEVANATAVMRKMVRVAEQTFRRVEVMVEVYRGVDLVDEKQTNTEVAA